MIAKCELTIGFVCQGRRGLKPPLLGLFRKVNQAAGQLSLPGSPVSAGLSCENQLKVSFGMTCTDAHGVLSLGAIGFQSERFKLLPEPVEVLRLQTADKAHAVLQIGLKTEGFNGELILPAQVFATCTQLAPRALWCSLRRQSGLQIPRQARQDNFRRGQVQSQITTQNVAPGTATLNTVVTHQQLQVG